MRLALFALICLALTGCDSLRTANGDQSVRAAAALPGVIYTVQPGDTLTTIARAHGIDMAVIVEANDLRSNRLEPGRTLRIPGGRLAPTGAPEPSPVASGASPTTLPAVDWYRPRSDWAVGQIRESLAKPMEKPFRITIHHSGRSDDAGEPASARLPKIERVHQAQLWACIGYHWIIDADGVVWEGRPMRYQGAHAHGDANNRGNIGVCLLGDFETGRVPTVQAQALRTLLERLCRDYGIERAQTYVHRDLWDGTECPGKYLKQVVVQWRNGGGPGPVLRSTQVLDR